MTIQCPKCKAENPDESKFCNECGTQIQSNGEIPASSTMTLQPDELKSELENIGPYKILEKIGSGGMGTVYLAHQEKPIKRKVAIKVIKPGMDSKEVIARFESEQQALALMNHPNIAQVHDSGITEDGYPYFVMEYVPGRLITEYCDKHKMTIDVRLTLFEKVCDAIQHAHFRGIIHRDIKPTNVLVTYQDDEHIPKIIDFGLAKALTGQDLTEKTLHTLHGVGVGTPTYMSPEQTELTSYDVDTRTDVYSLGVLLYELLVGRTPFDIAELERVGVMEILRIIREEDPPKPSTRFSSLGDASTTITKKRKTTPVEMIKRFKGDLDIIVMKALEKNRSQRYKSASDLAEDISRYVNKEPIQARAPSIWYKLKKYVGRHKAATITAGIILLLIVFFSFWNIIERQKAVKALKESNYNIAFALKEKAQVYAKENRWQLVSLFAANSLFYQIKAHKEIPMGDIEFPIGFQDWALKYSLFSLSRPLNSLTFNDWDLSPEGKYLALIGTPNQVKVWDITKNKLHASVKHEKLGSTIVKFSSDGRYLASGGYDGSIKIWEVSSGKEVASLVGHEKSVVTLAFSPKGKHLASTSEGFITIDKNSMSSYAIGSQGNLKIWEISSGKEISVFVIREKDFVSAPSLSFSPDGKYLILAGGGKIKVFELPRGKITTDLQIHEGLTRSASFSPNGKYLASGNLVDDKIKIWETSRGELVATLSGHRGYINSVSISADGEYLASGSEDQTIKIWDVAGREVLAVLNGTMARFTLDGKYLAVMDSENSQFNIWELRGAEIVATFKNLDEGIMDKTIFSPDRSLLASVMSYEEGEEIIKIWDVTNGNLISSLFGRKGLISSIDFSPDGRYFASAESEPKDGINRGYFVKIWEITSGKKVSVFWRYESFIHPVSFSPDGKYLAFGSRDGIRIWDFLNEQEVDILRADQVSVITLSFSPNGRYLASGGADKTINIWDLASSKLIASGKHNGYVYSVSFSPDGKLLASGSEDKTIKIWDFSDMNAIKTLKGHNKRISSVCFNPSGKYLVSRSQMDNTIKIWEISTGELAATLRGHNNRVHSVAFSPDGRLLVSEGENKSVKIWDLSPILNYFLTGLEFPIEEEEVKRILKEVEKQTGLSLEGMKPINAGSYSNLASEYTKTGRYNEAIELYKKALGLEPNFIRALIGLSRAYFLLENYDQASETLEKVIGIDKWNLEAKFNIVLILLAQEKYENAYDYNLSLFEESVVDQYSIEEYAIENIDELLKRNSNLTFAYLIRGYMYKKNVEYLMTVSDIDKFYEEAMSKSVWENYEKAESDINHFIREFKDNNDWKDVAKDLLLDLSTMIEKRNAPKS